MPRSSPNTHHPGPWWHPARAYALSAATLYRLPVFPLTRSKHPAIPSAHPGADVSCAGGCGSFGHGVHDASADPDTVRRLFAAAPWAAGYGIACGREPLFLFGLDLDHKSGVDGIANFHALATRHAFAVPATATVVTQSGGLHLWLTAPAVARVPNTVGLLAPGIDTRGHGGYLVGPGSLGPRGRYRFAPDSGPTEIERVPDQLLALLKASHKPVQEPPQLTGRRGGFRPAEGHLEPLVRFVLDCGPNDLNNRLYWASRKAFGDLGIDPETASGRLLEAAVLRGHPETPAVRTIASARRGAARDTAGRQEASG
ncbi:bifunctional DNA primase/polymerase [Actinacidiphila paucisporea]|uniref:Bifunctional DNA primase/polymerase, N-terminal n=1 Tax=Actinacidiphila paucisporea TaxID=310782 RepID=A0A1M6TF08_9ACTN|nr:bifunctional DNA primase/polymerase [Actinacidiphila paucisporea]SHK55622.1 Bifunctional DNA primase/polymerase, N-terminal [Actinacidiphila paucisporea]